MKIFKKALAGVLAVLCCMVMPLTAFATSGEDMAVPVDEVTTVSVEESEQTVEETSVEGDVATASEPVHAFGPGMYQTVGEFTFTDDNWTPIKTIYSAGDIRTFHFNGSFRKADSYNGLVKLTVKVKRVSDGTILWQDTFYPNADGTGLWSTAKFQVPEGQETERVQLYFDASTYNATPPGPYRSLWVAYDCSVY